MNKTECFSKLDTVEIHLVEAIRAFFLGVHPLVVNTIISSAVRLLDEYYKGTDHKLHVFCQFKAHREEIAGSKVNMFGTKNFCSHSQTDKHRILDFNPEEVEVMILEAASWHTRTTKLWHPECAIFLWWLAMKYEEAAKSGRPESLLSVAYSEAIEKDLPDPEDKMAYYDLITRTTGNAPECVEPAQCVSRRIQITLSA